jgi:DNA replication and repair protein RecF
MPVLKKISVTQFKNYGFASFSFTERVVGICGSNGVGKTNLLDAIYYLCFTKSYFSKTDAQNVQFGKDGFRLEGDIDGKPVVCVFRGAGKKEFYFDGTAYEKFSHHIGKFPSVVVAPDDAELVTGVSEERRKYMDTLLSQVDAGYLQQLIHYNKLLQQRNSLLKRFAEQGTVNIQLLEVMDEQIIGPANYIHSLRKEYSATIAALAGQLYQKIAGKDETVSLQYESQLNGHAFYLLLQQNREKDLLLQRTNAGIHKDEIGMLLNGQVFKTIASQGQRKSLLFALKLAEFETLKKAKGFAPILLLDDVFEKLDNDRMQHLLHEVCSQNTGQVFITDTHRERLEQAFATLGAKHQLIEL